MKRNTAGSYFEAKPSAESIHLRFESRVAAQPEAVAVVYEDQAVTYGHLNQKANLLAHFLIDLGVGPDTLAPLCVERSIDMIIGILGVLKAGGAYVPVDPSYPRERLAWILEDLKPPIWLTQQCLRDQLPAVVDHLVCLDADWPVIAEPGQIHNPVVDVDPDNVCYVIYTSGSTGQPKGVPVHHRNLLRLFDATQPWFEINEQDVWTLHHSYAFDFSVWEIFGAILHGGRLVIVSNWAVRSPEATWEVLSRERVTVLNQTPSGFLNLMSADQWNEGQVDHLALSLIIFGGEALNPGALRPWFHRHGDAHPLLVNMYGITETTVHVTYRPLTMQDAERAEHSWIGEPIPDLQVHLLDAQMNLVPVGVTGEIYVGGGGVARGYLNRPELAAERFVPDPFSLAPGARLYRSGDNGRFLADGDLEYLGRTDHQVKIRGHRIELGEIESLLARHSAVRESVVAVREGASGDKQLIAYIVPHAADDRADDEVEAPGPQLRRMLKDYLPDYMIPSAFVFLDEFPRTVNGKIDRRAMPTPLAVGMPGGGQEPRTPVEEILSGIFSEVLGHGPVGIDQNFSDLGGHSLLATQVVSRVRQVLEVEIGVRALFESPTVAGLARTVEQERGAGRRPEAPIVPAPRDREQLLSFAQERLWFLDRLFPNNPFYNVTAAFRLRGYLRVEVLEQVFTEIVRRHETLRTSFKTVEGRPVQEIAPAAPFKLGVTDLSGLASGELEAEAKRQAAEEAANPFVLARGDLMRARLLRLGPAESTLLFTMHHIISDGWSLGVLAREVAALYKPFVRGDQSPLAELPIQYADYAVWQRRHLAGEALDAQLRYWKGRLGGEFPPLNLPTDRPRPMSQSFRGATSFLPLPATLMMEIRALCQRRGVTLYMLLLTAFTSLLRRYTGQDDIIIGSPIANRTRVETEGLIGFFVNTLALRTDLSGDPSFSELLQRARAVALEAYGRQDIPFELLVERLKPERDINRNPLFQVMFQLENTPKETLRLPGVELIPVEVERGTTQFDLSLDIIEGTEGFISLAEYSTDLFDRGAIDRLLGHFQILLKDITQNPDRRVTELQLLTCEERRQLLEQWNETDTDVDADICVHQLFSALAEKAPHTIALTRGAEALTYGMLNRRANQLAHHLQAMGVGPETIVALCLERSVEVMVALLAVLKAGGAYLPLDPKTPAARLSFMLEDAGARLLLTQERLQANLTTGPALVICLDTEWETIARRSAADPNTDVDPDNLAYMIYTSGSTGAPKGAAITHRALVNHNLAVGKQYRLRPCDKVLHFASVSFDVAAEEIFPTLLGGAVIALDGDSSHDEDATNDWRRLAERERLTVLNLPASFWREWIRQVSLEHQALPPSLRLVVVGSEKVPSEWLAAWRGLEGADRIELINAYGTSETTITSTLYQVLPDLSYQAGRSLPIGRPISNTQIYLLDDRLQPVPVGVAGELYIGGAGLARGYHKRADVTAEKFVPDWLSPERGARLYRTGDIGRYLPDGNIEYLRRIDHQVKIRGYRIELQEIEAVLTGRLSVKAAVVVEHEPVPGDLRLVAYIVPSEVAPAFENTGSLIDDCRRLLRRKLPEYMTPSNWVLLDALPLLPSGKIDRRALPAPGEARSEGERVIVAPRTPIEAELARLWGQLLDLDEVSIYDNFFDLGGHSLLLTQLASRIRNLFQIDLPLRALFNNPTLVEMRDAIIDRQLSQADATTIGELVGRLKQLSPDEIGLALGEGHADLYEYPE